MTAPVLSIIMPLYNSERFIGQAIQSLLTQSFKEFELIIIDDASSDGSLDIVKEFKDGRIRILINEKNQGISFTRNKGLNVARGRFIAPFDSDDVAMPDKFAKQVRFLGSHPGYGMIGSWAQLIDHDGNFLKKRWKLPAKPKAIPAILLFRNYFCHSSIIMRREAIPIGGYDDRLQIGEDYKMWIEIARKWKVWNLSDYLLHYRVHPESMTGKNEAAVNRYDMRIYREGFGPLGIDLSQDQLDLLMLIKDHRSINNRESVLNIEQFLLLIIKRNSEKKVYNHQELVKVVFNRWLKVLHKTRGSNLAMPALFLKSPLLRTYLSVIA